MIYPFAQVDTRASIEALFLCGVPAVVHGNAIQMATDQVGVSEACSGVRSLHAALMLSLLLGELYFLRPRSRVILLGGGVILTFLVNIGRTVALSWVCAKHGAAALQKWHDPIGLIGVVSYMAGLLVLAILLRSRKRDAEPVDAAEPGQRPLRLPAPVPAVLCISMAAWFVFLECGTKGWFRMRESAMRAAVDWSFELPQGAQTSTNASETVDRAYRADETISGNWAGPDGSQWQIFYLRWKHGSKTGQLAKAHWPEICLRNAGFVLHGAVETKQYEINHLKLPFRTYAFEDNSVPLFVFHCVYEESNGAASRLKLDLQPKLASRIQAAWEGKRNLGQQLLEVIVRGFKDSATAEAAFKAQLEKMIKVKG